MTGVANVHEYETIKYIPTPLLTITRQTATVALNVSWTAHATDFVLERSDALNASSWTRVPLPYQTNAGRIFITEPTLTGNRFYRLRKP